MYHVPEQKVLPYTVRSQSYDLPNGNYTVPGVRVYGEIIRMKCAQTHFSVIQKPRTPVLVPRVWNVIQTYRLRS